MGPILATGGIDRWLGSDRFVPASAGLNLACKWQAWTWTRCSCPTSTPALACGFSSGNIQITLAWGTGAFHRDRVAKALLDGEGTVAAFGFQPRAA